MLNTLSTNEFYAEINALSLDEFLLWFKEKIDSHWSPLSDKEVKNLEYKWGISFPLAHRKLLTILGHGQRENSASTIFYNWNEDQEGIAKALAWPLEGLRFDVENGLWGKNWGIRPDSVGERKTSLAKLVAKAPSLIPITGHRYILDYPVNSQNPVLSVYQSDIIVYGMSLQSYLLNEFAYMLNLSEDRAYRNALQGWDKDLIASIPFWGDFLV